MIKHKPYVKNDRALFYLTNEKELSPYFMNASNFHKWHGCNIPDEKDFDLNFILEKRKEYLIKRNAFKLKKRYSYYATIQ